MNPANPAPAGGQQQQQQQPQKPSIFKMILIYMVINQLINYFFKGGNQPPATTGPNAAYFNIYVDEEPLEFRMYVTNSEKLNGNETPVWEEAHILYNYDEKNYRETQIEFNVEDLLKNTTQPSLYAHFILQSTRSNLTTNFSDYAPYLMQNKTINLIDYRSKDKNLDQENLLFGGEKGSSSAVKEKPKDEKYPHIKTRVWIQLVHDLNAYPNGSLPQQLSPEFHELTTGQRIYIPILDVSQFWLRKKDYALLDLESENKTINTTFSFNTYWVYKYMMESQLKTTDKTYEQFGMGGDNMEEIKEMIMDSNPILVGTTMVVSMLHSLFEFLAIKNEISFWKNIESHKGLSLRSLWVSLVTEIIVLLYLFDNDTSFLILISSFAGLGVTIWKIYKTSRFTKRADGKFPYIEIDYQEAYKSTTMQYDQVASKYLGWILVPLLTGYTIYSLIYEKHKGWYSFVVQTLVGFIYVFGFIEMTPQLYINYKLKSVEHLPWRVLIYKFLNTIVDDLFAFVITMPWLKRLSCFRDDIIFLIYLYQRWIYRVDKTRDPYGKPIPKEELEAQKRLEASKKAEKKGQAQKQVTSSENQTTATAEEATVTQRKTQEVGEEKSGSPQRATEQSAAGTQKASKMKKKKVE